MGSTGNSITEDEQVSVGFMFPRLRRQQDPKIGTAVSTLTFSYCVFIIKFIVFCCSNRRRRPGILSSFGENIHKISHM